MRLGIIANEFFDPALGRMGGFGWAARQVTRCFLDRPQLGVRVRLLTADPSALPSGQQQAQAHGAPLELLRGDDQDALAALGQLGLDLLLTIDYRPNYRPLIAALPTTPLIVWVRDPRSPQDLARIASLRIPGLPAVVPAGVRSINCTSLGELFAQAQASRRPMLLASPAPHLADRVAPTYNIHDEPLHLLPNIITLDSQPAARSVRPLVVFLSRLDPIKRPWLFVELACRFPDVAFLMLGRRHFAGAGGWEPPSLPDNLQMLGHVGEAEKRRLLASAWVLVNTAIHEGLAVSFQEALACATPIISGENPGGVTARYGIAVEQRGGAGLEMLPELAAALDRLLRDAELRRRLGEEGRQWVRATHSQEHFLTSFSALCDRCALTRASPS